MKLGMYAYLKFFQDTIANIANADSREMAWMKNLGSPNGIPKAPTMQIDIRTATPYLCKVLLILIFKSYITINKINYSSRNSKHVLNRVFFKDSLNINEFKYY